MPNSNLVLDNSVLFTGWERKRELIHSVEDSRPSSFPVWPTDSNRFSDTAYVFAVSISSVVGN